MKLHNFGEVRLIQEIARSQKLKLTKSVIGIGDDCAAWPSGQSKFEIATTDMLIEGVHFRRDWMSPFEIGWKSLAVNLSDIAAMGGKPKQALLSLALPGSLEMSWVNSFMRGFQSLARRYGVFLVGGDTVGSPSGIVVNICILGEVGRDRIKLRSGLKKGDLICVTGFLGDSAAGLHAFERARQNLSFVKPLLSKHRKPRPQLDEGIWLAQQGGVHAMMDVSDGVASDLGHMARASSLKIIVDLEKIPLSKPLRSYGKKYGLDPMKFSLGGGEDYCLLVGVSKKDFARIQRDFSREFHRPLFIIGRAVFGKPFVEYHFQEKIVSNLARGYDHFWKKERGF